MPRLTETRARTAAVNPKGIAWVWCSEIKGFGVRVVPSGVRSWIVQGRHNGKPFRITLGRVGVLALNGPEDRPGAAELAVLALNAARRGDDPSAAVGRITGPVVERTTVADLWEAFRAAGSPRLDGAGFRRASSIQNDIYRYRAHVARKLGKEVADDLDNARVVRWLDGIKGSGARANALLTLKLLLSFGASRGLCREHSIRVAAPRSAPVMNYLTAEQCKSYDAALMSLVRRHPHRILGFLALRAILQTGCRKSEILDAHWTDLDLDERVLNLRIDKTSDQGRRVLLSDAAVETFRMIPRVQGDKVVFPSRGVRLNLRDAHEAILTRAGLKHIRIHDLRHSFATVLLQKGVKIEQIGTLLGHKCARTTQRYAHMEEQTVRDSLDMFAAALSATPRPSNVVRLKQIAA